MKKFLLFFTLLAISNTSISQIVEGQSCAGGAGTIVVGAVSGVSYCRSHVGMNWWNAVSWCDSQGKQLFDLTDCGCSWQVNCQNRCPEIKFNDSNGFWHWSQTSNGMTNAYVIENGGKVETHARTSTSWVGYNYLPFRALCK